MEAINSAVEVSESKRIQEVALDVFERGDFKTF